MSPSQPPAPLCVAQVFIRELISNGSDALEKLRHKLITGGGDTSPMEIHLQTDSAKGTFTIQVSSQGSHGQGNPDMVRVTPTTFWL